MKQHQCESIDIIKMIYYIQVLNRDDKDAYTIDILVGRFGGHSVLLLILPLLFTLL